MEHTVHLRLMKDALLFLLFSIVLSQAKALKITFLRMFDRAQYVFTKSYWGNLAGAQVVDTRNKVLSKALWVIHSALIPYVT